MPARSRRSCCPQSPPGDCAEWREEINGFRRDRSEAYRGEMAPETILAALREVTGPGCTVVSDVGQHQMWVAKLYGYDERNSHITSGGLGTMGFAVPAAMGVHFARPERPVWAISGDGGFQMNMQEIATMVQEGIPVKMAIFNNGYLGMVRQWQQFFHGRRYSATPIWSPDYVKLAEAYGIAGFRVEHGWPDRRGGGASGARSRARPGRVHDRAGGQRLPDDSARRFAVGADRIGARAEPPAREHADGYLGDLGAACRRSARVESRHGHYPAPEPADRRSVARTQQPAGHPATHLHRQQRPADHRPARQRAAEDGGCA